MLYKLAIRSIFVLCLLSIWICNATLTPDSTNYLSAASSFISQFNFITSINWPDQFSLIGKSSFYVQPLGFPLVIAPFFIVINDPFVVALISQSIFIVLFSLGCIKLCNLLNFEFIFELLFYVFICSFSSFNLIFSNFWSETFFLVVTLWALILLLEITTVTDNKSILYFIIVILAGLSFSVRLLGILNYIFILVPFFIRKANFRDLFAGTTIFFVPILLWQIRNKYFLDLNSLEHYSSTVPVNIHDNFLGLINSIAYTLTDGSNEAIYLTLFILFLYVVYITIACRWRIITHRCNIGFTYIITLTFVFSTYVLGYFAIALFTSSGGLFRIETEQLRVLSPFYFIIITWVFANFSYFYKINRKFTVFYPMLLILYFSFNHHFWAFLYVSRGFSVTEFPPEKKLWELISTYSQVKDAKVVYIDHDFIHQLYSGKNNVVLWNELIGEYPDDNSIAEFVSKSDDVPVFVVRNGSTALNKALESGVRNGMFIADVIDINYSHPPLVSCEFAPVYCAKYKINNSFVLYRLSD